MQSAIWTFAAITLYLAAWFLLSNGESVTDYRFWGKLLAINILILLGRMAQAGYFFLLIVVLVVVSSASSAIAADRPPVELAAELRHGNYGREGSCAYAAAADVLAIQGRQDLGRYVCAHYAGGAMVWPTRQYASLQNVAESMGIRYDFTVPDERNRANVRWLQRVTDLGLGAVIPWCNARDEQGQAIYGHHAIAFLGFDAEGCAWLLDNEYAPVYLRLSRKEFLDVWRKCGGYAFTFLAKSTTQE